MKSKINIKKLMINMEHKNIQAVSIDKENQLYNCSDGIEYPLMEGWGKVYPATKWQYYWHRC